MRGIQHSFLVGVLVSSFPVAAFDGLSVVQVVEAGSDQPAAFCADFNLSGREAASVLRKSKKITSQEYLEEYLFLPCYVKGTARLGHDLVEWMIRAGGNVVITKADGTEIYLGCQSCKKSFGARQKKGK